MRFLTKDANKHLAGISLDLDNKWSYLKVRGTPGWEKFPTYLDIFIPRVLEELKNLGLSITFFIVGQDAVLEQNREALQLLTKMGHEVGNHSFHHEPWFHLYSREQIKEEIQRTHNLILENTGKVPIGFRGPGYSWNQDLIEILAGNGYLYDASSLPTYLGPLARLYYFWTSRLSEAEREKRSGLFGGFKEGFRPVKPYFWHLPSDRFLLEIPVTSTPFFKMPFHMSYLIYLASYSESLMFNYLRFAVALCKIRGFGPSFLLHPLDFLDADLVPELAFFPAMTMRRDKKIRLFRDVINILSRHFKLVDLRTLAQNILESHRKKIADSG
jgi:hypothetical protein